MIPFSVICCVWKREEWEQWTRPCFEGLTDDIVEVASDLNIMAALNRGTALAKHRVKVYVHDDVEILDREAFVRDLEAALAMPDVGLVGVIGCERLDTLPWWHEPWIGAVSVGRKVKAILGTPVSRPTEVEVIDGFIYATAEDVWLPEREYRGFHFYDMEVSRLVRERGKRVMVAPWQVHHFCRLKPSAIVGEYMMAAATFQRRWPGSPTISDRDWSHIRDEHILLQPVYWDERGRRITKEEAKRLLEESDRESSQYARTATAHEAVATV